MFVRLPDKDKTATLINTALIWKIEVRHFAGTDKRVQPSDHPEARRIYRVFIGNDVLTIDEPDGELRQELDRIYGDKKPHRCDLWGERAENAAIAGLPRMQKRQPTGNGNLSYPCGYLGDPKRQCHCNPLQIERYLGRISGPLLDRLDIHIEVPPVPFRELSNTTSGTNSGTMREQVIAARDIQRNRFGATGLNTNGKMTPSQIRKHCPLDAEAENLLKTAMESMGLSARAHDKILRLGRTIADLDRSDRITVVHLSEAINYRTLDKQYWKS